jgi:hypothetical protein
MQARSAGKWIFEAQAHSLALRDCSGQLGFTPLRGVIGYHDSLHQWLPASDIDA